MEKDHIVTITDKEPVRISSGNKSLIDIVKDNVGNQQRQGSTLRYTALTLNRNRHLLELVDELGR